MGATEAGGAAETEWMSQEMPGLRIVSDDTWEAAHARLDAARKTYLRGTNGRVWGRPPSGVDSKYLLTGLVRCDCCGGGNWLRSRSHGSKGHKTRVHRYACAIHDSRGGKVCANGREALMEDADLAALELLGDDVLDPAIVMEVTRRAVAALTKPADTSTTRKALAG